MRGFGQIDDRQAFLKLKKHVGTWQAIQNDEKVYEIWKLNDKSSIQINKFSIQGKDTIQLMNATINYSKFVRFVHTSSVHYNIKNAKENSIYPFRLEFMEGNTFEFSNFNNPYPNKIIYHFIDKNTLTVSIISKDKKKEEILNYKQNP